VPLIGFAGNLGPGSYDANVTVCHRGERYLDRECWEVGSRRAVDQFGLRRRL